MYRIAFAALAALTACAPAPQVASGPQSSGALGLVTDCTVLDARRIEVTRQAGTAGARIGGVGGGLAGTLLG
uniref:hypothetical protein n=1 Tax=Roseobacter sp. HKCCA0434 TaxID=3079297 RepID=UPI002905A9F4